jgi:mono/diheme cytochrome c family protein
VRGAVIGLWVLLLAACGAESRAAPPRDVQVAWGRSVFQWECAQCHAAERSVQPLTQFNLPQYSDALTLYGFISSTMPMDDPGGLPDYDYWAVTAFLLDREGMLDLPAPEVLGRDNARELEFLP